MSSEPLPTSEADETPLVSRVDLTVPGDVGGVTPAVERIMDIVRDLGCAEGKEFEVELALTEALANAVRHGCGGDPAKLAHVSVGCDEERGLVVVIRDPGPGFDPAAVPDPLDREQLMRTGGRGVFLIRRLMDDVRYTRGGSEVILRKK